MSEICVVEMKNFSACLSRCYETGAEGGSINRSRKKKKEKRPL